MDAHELRGLQAPLKQTYRDQPEAAVVTFTATAELDPHDVSCRVPTFAGEVTAGLHPAAGGPGDLACSGDMLLEALAACAGVTLRSVATAMRLEVTGSVTAHGEIDFRGTLALLREVPVGFRSLHLRFDLVSPEPRERLERLVELTERYCVVFQTLNRAPEISVTVAEG